MANPLAGRPNSSSTNRSRKIPVLIPSSHVTARVNGGKLNVIGSLLRRTSFPLSQFYAFDAARLLLEAHLRAGGDFLTAPYPPPYSTAQSKVRPRSRPPISQIEVSSNPAPRPGPPNRPFSPQIRRSGPAPLTNGPKRI